MSGDGLLNDIGWRLVGLPVEPDDDGELTVVDARRLADAVLPVVQARIDAAREQVAEQIAQAIEARAKDGTWNVGGQVVLGIAAGIAREHAKGDSDE